MNLIDKVILEWSYRTEKGYPDINNENDLKVFESLFGYNLNEEVKNKANTIKAVQAIVAKFGSEYDIKPLPSKSNRLSAPGIKDQNVFLKLIRGTFGDDIDIKVSTPHRDGNPSGKFNMYTFNAEGIGEVNLIISYSAPGGAGVGNEAIFVNTVNKLIEEAGETVTVVLKDGSNTRTFKNITSSKKVGTSAGKGMKADVQLESNDKVVANLSVKQDGSFRWESVNNNNTPFRENFVNYALTDPNFPIDLKPTEVSTEKKPKYLMYRAGTEDRITKVFVKNAPTDANELFAFGKDVPKTIIIGRTFNEDDFTLSGNTITITLSSLYSAYEDIPENLTPVFTVEQHAGQKYGLDFRIVPKEKAKLSANGIEIDYSDVD